MLVQAAFFGIIIGRIIEIIRPSSSERRHDGEFRGAVGVGGEEASKLKVGFKQPLGTSLVRVTVHLSIDGGLRMDAELLFQSFEN